MKKNTFLYLMAALLLLISATFLSLASLSSGSSHIDRMNELSYSLGLKIGKNMVANGININVAMFLRGMDDGRRGLPPILTNDQVSQANESLLMIMQCQMAEENARLPSQDKFMINNLPGVNNAELKGILNY